MQLDSCTRICPQVTVWTRVSAAPWLLRARGAGWSLRRSAV